MRDVQDWISVKRLYKNGVNKQRIAKELHMARNTVKRLIKTNQEPQYTRAVYTSKVDSYQDLIRDWYLNPQNAYIVVLSPPIVTLVSFVQPWKAIAPILVTLPGMVTLVRLVQL